jgi:Fe-Mn family superoxide dismutase
MWMVSFRHANETVSRNKSGRRRFLGSLGLGATALALLPKLASAEPKPVLRTMSLEAQSVEQVNGQFVLPPLPYRFEVLEPWIDAETMYIHHDKHHQAFVTNLNTMLQNTPDLRGRSATDLVYNLESLPMAVQTTVRNSGGGHINHAIFWATMGPNKGGTPTGALGTAINATFGNFDTFKSIMSTAAAQRFGSGWGWLVMNFDGSLQVISTANQDSPYMFGQIPLLGVDVWEHAYYLKYRQKRPEYLAAWWNTVDWDAVGARYMGAMG